MNNIFAVAGLVIKELYRRKDFYVLFVLTALITLLLGSVNFFNDDRIIRYLKDVCLLLIWISTLVIAVTTTARQIPAERESRTIFPLLAKPMGRGELIVGKFLGCWAACGTALIVFYFFFGIISASKEHTISFAPYIQAIWLHWMCLGIVIAMVLLGSIVFAAPSSNATICLIVIVGIMFAGGHLNGIATGMRGFGGGVVYALYYVIPHLEWYDVRDLVVHNWGSIDWLICGGATIYAVAYVGFLLGVTWAVFKRKPMAS
ncbi:MAG TPA: ABC transporter permease subunit [Verrucomicrobiae bacterium]|jgi:ABC-type transport system involved in multi-copper enzyme maturation permease subunit